MLEPNEVETCKECYALVLIDWRVEHSDWHETLGNERSLEDMMKQSIETSRFLKVR